MIVLKIGLAFDDWDLTHYTGLFKNNLKRNPTSVECFDLAQSNRCIHVHCSYIDVLIVSIRIVANSSHTDITSYPELSYVNDND